MGNPPEKHLKRKSRENSDKLKPQMTNRFEIMHITKPYYCRALLSATSQIDWIIDTDVMAERIFAKFESFLRFGGLCCTKSLVRMSRTKAVLSEFCTLLYNRGYSWRPKYVCDIHIARHPLNECCQERSWRSVLCTCKPYIFLILGCAVYWCEASKLKAPRNSLLNESHLGGFICFAI